MSRQPIGPSSARAMVDQLGVPQTEERGEDIHQTFSDGFSDQYVYSHYQGTTTNVWYDQVANQGAMTNTTHYAQNPQGWLNGHMLNPAPSPQGSVITYGPDVDSYPIPYLPIEDGGFQGLNRHLKEVSNPPHSTSDEDNLLEDPGDVEISQQSPDTSPVPNRGVNQAGTGRPRASSSTLADLDVLECNVEGCHSQFRGEYRKSNLARHSRLRHASGGRLYPCEGGCDKVFKRQDARLKHYRRKHPNMPTLPPVPRPRNGTPTA